MKRTIPVMASVGHGRTALSAYDDALWRAGVANCNLIALSSVIPPDWMPQQQARLDFVPHWGNRLYVVQAKAVADGARPTGLAAGIGWALFGHGGGVFVEHAASAAHADDALAEVERRIALSLADLCQRRDAEPVARGQVSVGATADGPGCALVVAVFQQENW